MGSFGEHLRRQREMRGISLDEIVATTKIGRRLLVALEEEQFDLLPGGIFNKSYVRAYAKCVGIDEDEAVTEYLEAAQEQAPDTRVIAQQHASIHSDRRPESSGFPIVPVLILLVVAAGGVGGWKAYQDHRKEKGTAIIAPATEPSADSGSNLPATAGGQQTTAQPASSSTPQNTAPVATNPPDSVSREPAKTGSSAVRAAAEQPNGARDENTAAGAPFEVTIRPKDRAWVSVKSDGKYVIRGIIKPPDVKTVRASSEVVFYTGNAGEIAVTFNGKDVPLSGGLNEEQTLVFDSRGLMPRTPAARNAPATAPTNE